MSQNLKSQSCISNDDLVWNSFDNYLTTTSPSATTYTESQLFTAVSRGSVGDIAFGPDGKLYAVSWFGNSQSDHGNADIYLLSTNQTGVNGTSTSLVIADPSENDNYANNSLHIDQLYNFYWGYWALTSTQNRGKIFWKGPSNGNTIETWATVGSTVTGSTSGSFTGDITIHNGKLYALWTTNTATGGACNASGGAGEYKLLEFGINPDATWDGNLTEYDFPATAASSEPQGITSFNGELYMNYSCNSSGTQARITTPIVGSTVSVTNLTNSIAYKQAGQTSKTAPLGIIGSTPQPNSTSGQTSCPAGTFDLTSLEPSSDVLAGPGNNTYEWHTVANPTDASTKVADPNSAPEGTYYLVIKGTINSVTWSGTTGSYTPSDCYSKSGSAVTITGQSCGPAISGNVFNDPNSGNVDNSSGMSNTVPAGMYANLIDASGNVVAVTAINTDGTYAFSGQSAGTYSVVLSTTQGSIGSAAPSASLPPGWINTGESNDPSPGTPDASVDGVSATFSFDGTNDTNDIDFGIKEGTTLSITKDHSPSGPFESGDVISYTIVVTNTGTADAENITLDDLLPSGVTYVTNSAMKTYNVDNPGPEESVSGTISHTFSPVVMPSGLTHTFSHTIEVGDGSPAIPSNAMITSYSYTASIDGSFPGDISVMGTYPGGEAFSSYNFGNGNLSTSGDNTSVSGTALGEYTFVFTDAYAVDGNNLNAGFSIDWEGTTTGAGTRNPITNAAATPPSLVSASDNVTLQPNETLTVTYNVTVNSDASGNLTNTATANSDQSEEVSTSDIIEVNGATYNVSGALFNDADALEDNIVDGLGIGSPGGTQMYANLIDATGNVVATTPISSNGTYSFSEVNNGSYTVQFSSTEGTVGQPKPDTTLPNGWTNTGEHLGAGEGNDGEVNGELDITVSNADVTEANAGIRELGSLSGTVFLDDDALNDNTVDGTGLGNPDGVQLYANLVDSNGNIYQSVAVNADGTYSFTGLPAGDYTVEISINQGSEGSTPPTVELPSGWSNTGENIGSGAGNDGNTNGISNTATVVVGQETTDVNFGIIEPASVSGTVFNNENQALSGATITLQDDAGNTIKDINGNDLTVVTGMDGTYSFTNIPPGTYNIVENDPMGYTSVSAADNNIDGADDTEQVATNSNSIPVSLVGGENDTQNDFVDTESGTISGNVSADTTGDGNNDTNLQGVTIELLDGNGDPVMDENDDPITTTTDMDGNYSFDNVPPGEYQVRQQQPDDYATTGDSQSTDNDTATNDSQSDNIIPVTLAAGETDASNNFTEEAAGSISGNVREDSNGDGMGDTALEGVELALLDSNGDPVNDANGDPITTTTDENGNYSFDEVPVGTGYQVQETDPDGYTSSSDVEGFNNNKVTGIDVTAGQDAMSNNFVDSTPVAISGTVLADENGNGTADTPLSGVTIELLDANGDPVLDANGDPITTTTDSNGNYSFMNLPKGMYQLRQEQPEGYTSTDDADGNATENIINVDATSSDVTAQNFEEETDAALPVGLISFSAKAQGGNAILHWTTASEINNDRFEIESSMNGDDFNKIGVVNGSGTTSEIKHYSYIDRSNKNRASGIYYRLKQIDYDGAYEYSTVVYVTFDDIIEEINIYPNPTANWLQIDIKEAAEMLIFNLEGKIVKRQALEAGYNSINISDLENGSYLIKAGVHIKKVVKF